MELKQQWASYWREGSLDEYLHRLNLEVESNYFIAKDKLMSGVVPLEYLKTFSEEPFFNDKMEVLLAPNVLKHEASNKYEIPFVIRAYIDKEGSLSIHKDKPFPYFQEKHLEPFSKCLPIIGQFCDFENEINLLDLEELYDTAWMNFVEQPLEILDAITHGAWHFHFREKGYYLMDEVMIFPMKYIKKDWLYQQQVFQVTKNSFNRLNASIEELSEGRYLENYDLDKKAGDVRFHLCHVNEKKILSDAQRALVQYIIADKNSESVVAVKALPGSGKSFIAKDVLANLWCQAALNEKLPPRIGWINSNNKVLLPLIFHCIDERNDSWLDDKLYTIVQGTSDIPLSISSHSIRYFINLCQIHIDSDILNLADAKKHIFNHLKQTVEQLQEGISIVEHLQCTDQLIHAKYNEFGGLENRILQLEESLNEQRAHQRHIEVLYSLWLRQLEKINLVVRMFSFMPLVQHYFYQKLKNFFHRHLPDVDIENLTFKELNNKFSEMTRKSKASEEIICAYIQQVRADKQQWDIAHKRLSCWLKALGFNINCMEVELKDFDTMIRHRIFQLTLHYYEATLLQNHEWTNQDIAFDAFLKGIEKEQDFFKEKFDLLFVEQGDFISPSLGVTLIENSKKVVVMGSFYEGVARWTPGCFDYQNAKLSNLIDIEDDYETIRFIGLDHHTGGLFKLANQLKNVDLDEYELDVTWDTQDGLLQAIDTICHMQPLFSNQKCQHKPINIQAVQGTLEPYLGSFINKEEVKAIVYWLQENPSLDVAVVTVFEGQKQVLQHNLQRLGVMVPVYHIGQKFLKRHDTLLLSSCYTPDYKETFILDEDSYFLHILSRVKHQLIWFCHNGLFSGASHSLSNKLYIFVESYEQQLSELAEDIKEEIMEYEEMPM